MTIAQVYQHFRLPQALQTHHYRVAGVAKLICGGFETPLDTESVVLACLLHDLGNLIKFELPRFPDLLAPEGLAYWTQVQTELKAAYGQDEHQATLQMAQELGVAQRVLELIDAVGFDHTQANFESGDLELMIPEYADDRVTPWGVVSLDERIQDLETRYGHMYPGAAHQARRREFAHWAKEIEKAIFKQSQLSPSEINETSVQAVISQLPTIII